MNRLEKFKESYDDAISSINRFIEGDDSQGLAVLTKWMLETECNPYGYLPHDWAGALSYAEGFAGLLHSINHALYDDGEMCFVSVNGTPRIVFEDKYEPDFATRVLSPGEREMQQRGTAYNIQVLDMSPRDFGAAHELAEAKSQAKREHIMTVLKRLQ